MRYNYYFLFFLCAGLISTCLASTSNFPDGEVGSDILQEQRPFMDGVDFDRSNEQFEVAMHPYWREHLLRLRVGMRRSGKWHTVSKEDRMLHFGRQEQSIHTIKLYSDRSVIPGRAPIALFILHGTWAKEAPEFTDDSDEIFQGFEQFALSLSSRFRAPIELVFFSWSGEDSYNARFKAGADFADICNMFYGPRNGYAATCAWGHSHGCNAINIASHETYFDFDGLFYVAAPVVESTDTMYRPGKFKWLYNIYSSSDPVQNLGAFNRSSTRKLFSNRGEIRKYQQQNGRMICNIRVQFDGWSPGHVAIKRVVFQLLPLIDAISVQFRYHSDLDVNLFYTHKRLSGSRRPILTIRQQIELTSALRYIMAQPYGMKIVREIDNELFFAQQEESAYKKRYRRSIHEKSSFFNKIGENLNDIREMIIPYAKTFWAGEVDYFGVAKDTTKFVDVFNRRERR